MLSNRRMTLLGKIESKGVKIISFTAMILRILVKEPLKILTDNKVKAY